MDRTLAYYPKYLACFVRHAPTKIAISKQYRLGIFSIVSLPFWLLDPFALPLPEQVDA